MRTLRIDAINGTSLTGDAGARTAAAAPACDVLNLDLRPISLDLLGLQVDLSRVVLSIVAQSGAGNLLCAVVGLLDGGLAGALGRLTNLLNGILGALRLGV